MAFHGYPQVSSDDTREDHHLSVRATVSADFVAAGADRRIGV
jgi:hypothetical protein